MLVRSYLQLFRMPGIFTAISNILFGFFVTQSQETTLALPLLVMSSISLYIAGMILNDFFDFDIDKKERPFRPLSSGKIPKNKALFLGVFFLMSANVWSFFVAHQSFLLSILMSSLIFFYNFQAKKNIPLGILTLSIIRFLNVELGASAEPLSNQSLLFPIPLAILIVGIGVLSKFETSSAPKQALLFNLGTIGVTILTIMIFFYERFNESFVFFITMFAASTILPLIFHKGKTSVLVQKIITYQLLSIIILDATMTVLFKEFFYGVIIISLYLPAFFIGKKLYVT